MTESSTSVSLLLRASRLDSAAWNRFVRIYSPLIYGWCRHLKLCPGDIEDVVQEVFSSVVGSLGRYLIQRPAKFRAWLWGVTRNKAIDHLRRLDKEPRGAGGETHQDLLANLKDAPPCELSGDGTYLDTLIVQRTLDLLKSDFEPATWHAFWRLAVGGEPAAKIAEDLEMTSRAVRQAKYRVLHRLRSELEGQLDWDVSQAGVKVVHEEFPNS